MKSDKFESILRQLRSVEVPACPDDMDVRVVRRIRREAANHSAGVGRDWLRLLVRPRNAFGLLVMSIALGAGTTAVASQMSALPAKASDPMGFGIITQPHVLECYHCKPSGTHEF